ncbi:oxygen-dependent coproporphyrinogen oxidase [Bacillus thuringiensis]|uniref:oxygen-dependent coproporphyrinogen oxidase n=1 Tax=Bacillus thuringiensis TaxID=1428 RepID=UPI001CB98782|nr:oxygen-dependent coproporphyrinogen oxidase [Bacillus thuringiensis]
MSKPIDIKEDVYKIFRKRHQEICSAIEAIGEGSFNHYFWTRDNNGNWQLGGSGTGENSYTDSVLQESNVFDKVGANLSGITGEMPEDSNFLTNMGIEERQFFVANLSFVFHPKNPMAPTCHFNYRYFVFGDGTKPGSWWFGGGADLTPSYVFDEDAIHFHQKYKNVCDKYDSEFYPCFKKWCDDYFYIKHRGEHRGVGGIFFDNLNDRNHEDLFNFIISCSGEFISSYIPIIERRKDIDYTNENKNWQLLRHGRYVEFLTLYDRGTKFGLETNGVHPESCLSPIPLLNRWEYNYVPEPGSEEERMLLFFKSPPIDWIQVL